MGYNYFDPQVWYRWDSGHYLHIAKEGYEFFPCAGNFGYSDDATEFCGNTGWFPGYPYLIKVLSIFQIDLIQLGSLVSKFFYFSSIFLCLLIADIKAISFRSVIFTLLSTFALGFIYYNAIFPMSMVLFFALLGMYLILNSRYVGAGYCCFVASFIYPTGFLLTLVFIAFLLYKSLLESTFKVYFQYSFFIAICGLCGILYVFGIFEYQVDEWKAFILVQGKYGHGIHNPYEDIVSLVNRLSIKDFRISDTISYQSFFAIFGYIILTVLFVIKKMYHEAVYFLTYIYISAYLIFPWIVGGDLSMYRSESLLFPYVLMLKDVKAQYLSILLIIVLTIGVAMSYLFFRSVLI